MGRAIARWLITAMLVSIAGPAFCQNRNSDPLTARERAQLIERVKLLRAETDAILRVLQSDDIVASASTDETISFLEILRSLKMAIDDMDALVVQAHSFLETGETQIEGIGGTIESELQNISKDVSMNLRAINGAVEEIGGHIDAEVLEITGEMKKLLQQLQLLIDMATMTTEQIGDDVDRELQILSDEITDSLSDITKNIAQLTERIGDSVDDELSLVASEIQKEIASLHDEIVALIEAATALMQESRLVMRDVRLMAEKTIGFVSSTDGVIASDIYFGEYGFDSRIDLTMWQNPDDDYPFAFIGIGGSDMDTVPRLRLMAGVTDPTFSIGFGYIEQGLGVHFGHSDIIYDDGFDVSMQAYRFADPLVDVEIGYLHSSGVRGFLCADDVLCADDLRIFSGIGYNLGF